MWLQAHYPGSGSLGISRSCKDGGVSEHKEGRAFDWAVSVYSARDRAYVADFMARLFATDAEGNTDALARRMGIMYLIWNDQIYSSYYGFRARPYKACSGAQHLRRHAAAPQPRAHLAEPGRRQRHDQLVHRRRPRSPPCPTAPTAPTVPTAPVVTAPALPGVPLVPKTKDGILDLRKRKFVTVTLSPRAR